MIRQPNEEGEPINNMVNFLGAPESQENVYYQMSSKNSQSFKNETHKSSSKSGAKTIKGIGSAILPRKFEILTGLKAKEQGLPQLGSQLFKVEQEPSFDS